MKIETQTLEDHQVKLTVEVEAESMEEAKHRAARHLARHVKIPGFRPGKAPYQVILRQIGEASIVQEALELLVKDIYPKVIEESGIEPYGPGSLENVVSMDPPVLEFVIPLEADVKLGDYLSIRRPYEPKEVTEQEVDAVLHDLRERQAVIEPVERPAQEGDMVNVRLSGRRTAEEEGQDSVLVRERSVPVILYPQGEAPGGAATASQWPFPGFSQHLIGLSVTDERTVTHKFSEDSDFESLRGVETEFTFTVEEVKSRTLPEVDDEFASTVGDYASLAALRDEIRKGLEQQARETYDTNYDEEVLGELVELSEIKYPPQMLEREIDNVIDNLKHRLEQQNLDIDLYLKTRSMDMAAMRTEARPVAETRLKKSLVLYELAEVENVQVAQEDVQNETIQTMTNLARSLSEKDARKLSDQKVFNNIVGSVMADMLTKRTLERLRDISSGKLAAQAEATGAAESVTESAPAVEAEMAAMEAGTLDGDSAPPDTEAAMEPGIELQESAERPATMEDEKPEDREPTSTAS